jgi:hypothetical protein
MNEGMLRRLIKRGLGRTQGVPGATEKASGSIDPSAAVVKAEDDGAPDEYEPEYSWGPVASAPNERRSAGYSGDSHVERGRPQDRRERP